MSNLTYVNAPNKANNRTVEYVYLGGRRVGDIRIAKNRGFCYKPLGGKPGEVFPTIAEVKATLVTPS